MPGSTIFYLVVCAQVLLLMIRKNKNLTGYSAVRSIASSPGGRNDRLVHTVMRMRLISEESRKIVYSCPRPQNGGTEGDELVLVGVFILHSRTLWDRRIATSSRHNRQSALDSIYNIAANKPHPCNDFYEYSLRKLSACA